MPWPFRQWQFLVAIGCDWACADARVFGSHSAGSPSRNCSIASKMPGMGRIFWIEAGWTLAGVALAAISAWLAIRIVNRGERWAKRTAAGLIVLLILYPLSMGPFWWFDARARLSDPMSDLGRLYVYWPI